MTRQEIEGSVIETHAQLNQALAYMRDHPLDAPLKVHIRARMAGWKGAFGSMAKTEVVCEKPVPVPGG